MRGYVPAYEAKNPASLQEALRLLADERGQWSPLAGGTDLMVLLEAGTLESKKLLNLHALQELRGITVSDRDISIGALTTFRQIQNHGELRTRFPLLCEAARSIGAIAIQNRATIGGNIANASPAADAPPALLVYDAEVELASSRGTRRIAYARFHESYKKTAMNPDELIKAIILPLSNGTEGAWIDQYRKVGTRAAQAISKICFAGRARLHSASSDAPRVIEDVRLAFGSVAPTVLRCTGTEQMLKGKPLDRKLTGLAKEQLARELAPIDDIRSNKEYRLQVSFNLLEDFLTTLKRE